MKSLSQCIIQATTVYRDISHKARASAIQTARHTILSKIHCNPSPSNIKKKGKKSLKALARARAFDRRRVNSLSKNYLLSRAFKVSRARAAGKKKLCAYAYNNCKAPPRVHLDNCTYIYTL